MHEVVGCVDKDTAVAGTEGNAGDEGKDPVDVRSACPTPYVLVM
jgi:hypothetical protein